MAAAAGHLQHISIPIFHKSIYSLDLLNKDGYNWNDQKWPTLEHLFWAIFVPSINIQPSHTPTYLRRKVRTSDAVSIALEEWTKKSNEHKKDTFIQLWKQQIETDHETKEKIIQYSTLEPIPQFYCVIPKNKSIYKDFGWNPDLGDSMNHLGTLFYQLVASYVEEKSVPTTRDTEDMMRNTFCPDCESLLFIRQKETNDSTTGTKQEVLVKECQVCDWEKKIEDDDATKPIYSSSGQKLSFTLSDHDIDEILQDPTLPRIHNIPCVNPVCSTNHLVDDEYGFIITNMADKIKRETISNQPRAETIGSDGLILFADTDESIKKRIAEYGLKEDEGEIIKGPVQRLVLYYRTNNDDLTYSYVCSTCKTVWSNQ